MSSHPQIEFDQISRPVMDALPDAVVVLDEPGRVIWANLSWHAITARGDGSAPESGMRGSYIDRVEDCYSLDRHEISALRKGIRALFDGEREQCAFDFTSRHNELARRVLVRAILVTDVEPCLVLVTHQAVDVVGPIELSPQLFHEAFDTVDEPFVVTDADGRIQYANGAHARFTGFSFSEMSGQSIWATTSDYRDPALEDAAWSALRAGKSWREELSIQRKDGEIRWEFQTITPLRDDAGRLHHLVAVGHDVTDRRTYVDELRRQAYYDGLTGLPNRTLFLDRLTHAHTRVRRGNQPLAVMFLDLNEFKNVNDRFGHQTGDAVLAEVARRLVGCLRASDTVARSGGDEFIFLLEEVAADGDAMAVARRMVEEISRPYEFEGSRFSISASIGIAFNTPAIADPEVLLRQADIALYHAKVSGDQQFVIYRESMTMPVADRP